MSVPRYVLIASFTFSIAWAGEPLLEYLTGQPGSALNRAAMAAPRASRPSAASKPGAPASIAVLTDDTILPHIADGGYWYTEFTFTNLDVYTIPFQVLFIDDNGNDLYCRIVGGDGTFVRGVSLSLPPRATVTFATDGSSADTHQGWAYIYKQYPEDSLGGFGVFRLSVPDHPDFEAVVPIVSEVDGHFVLNYDNINGTTGVAIANPGRYTAPIPVTVYDDSGNILDQGIVSLGPYAHTAKRIDELLPATAGRRGVIEVSAQGFGVAALGLRFNPTGPFTSVHVLSNINWLLQ